MSDEDLERLESAWEIVADPLLYGGVDSELFACACEVIARQREATGRWG